MGAGFAVLKTLSFSPFLTFLCFPLRCRCWQYARQSVKICLIDRVLIDFLFKLKAMFVLAESLFQNNLKRSPPKYLVGCRLCDWANCKVLWCKIILGRKLFSKYWANQDFRTECEVEHYTFAGNDKLLIEIMEILPHCTSEWRHISNGPRLIHINPTALTMFACS